jgi:hypothetical protein
MSLPAFRSATLHLAQRNDADFGYCGIYRFVTTRCAQGEPMSAARSRRQDNPKHQQASGRVAHSEARYIIALRQEAERGWAESERATKRNKRRKQAKATAHAQRRATAQAHAEEITKLKAKLEGAKRELSRHRRISTPSRRK